MKSIGKTKLLILVILFSLTGSVKAGLLLEPSLGYGFSTTNDISLGTSDFEAKYNGVSLGLRLGWNFGVFTIGLDAYGSPYWGTYKNKSTGNEIFPAINAYNWGVFVGGYWKAFILRGSYFINSNQEYLINEISSKDLKWRGNGFGLGVGWRILHWLSLSFDWRSLKYTKFNGDENAPDYKPNEFHFAVTFPIEFWK